MVGAVGCSLYGSRMTCIQCRDQQLCVLSMPQDSEGQGAFQTLFSYFEDLEFTTGELILFFLKLSGYQKNVLLLKFTWLICSLLDSVQFCFNFYYFFFHFKHPQSTAAPLPLCSIALCFGRGAGLGKQEPGKGKGPLSIFHTWHPLAASMYQDWDHLQGMDDEFPSPSPAISLLLGMESWSKDRGDAAQYCDCSNKSALGI